MMKNENMTNISDIELVDLFNQSVGIKATNNARQIHINTIQKELKTRNIDTSQIPTVDNFSYKYCVILEENTLKRLSTLTHGNVTGLLKDYFKKYHRVKSFFEPRILSYDNESIEFVLYGHTGNLEISSNNLIKSLASNVNQDPFEDMVENDLKINKEENEAVLAERIRKLKEISTHGIDISLRPTKESLNVGVIIPYYISDEILEIISSHYYSNDNIWSALDLGFLSICKTKWYNNLPNQSKEFVTEEALFALIEASINIGHNQDDIKQEVLQLKKEGFTNEQILEKYDDFNEINIFRISNNANPYEHALRSLEDKQLSPEQAMRMSRNINEKRRSFVQLRNNAHLTFNLNLKKQSSYKDLMKLKWKYTFVITIIFVSVYNLDKINIDIADYLSLFYVTILSSGIYFFYNYSKKSKPILEEIKNIQNEHFQENYLTIDKSTLKLVETLKKEYELLTDSKLDEAYLELVSKQAVKSKTQYIHFFVLHKEFKKRYADSPFYVTKQDDNKIKIRL